MDATSPATYDLTDYTGMARRHWWIMVAMLLVGVAGGALVAGRTGKTYEASTSVLVQPTANLDTNVVGGRTQGQINLDTEAQLVRSTAVATGALALLHLAGPPERLTRHLIVEVPPNTSVLVIHYEGGTPAAAQAGSRAFAQAYLQNRADSARAAINEQVTAVQAKITELSGLIGSINSRIARLAPGSPELGNLPSQRSIYITQVDALMGRANELTTTTVAPGKIISEPLLPSGPSSPYVPLYLGSGAMIGALAGIAFVLGRERLDRRVRRGADVRRRGGLPVVAELPRSALTRPDKVFAPQSPGGRLFNRLRNEMLASLRPEDRLIVVTGASHGAASALVAANLAAAFARSGNEVVLVGANVTAIGLSLPLSRMFDVADAPGLTDLITRSLPLGWALQRAPRVPRLRVVVPGATASATGLLQSDDVRSALRALRQEAEFVVVEAPSTASGAEAQSLASIADATLVVVELRRTLNVEVVDAAEQLRRVGGHLLGTVVLPRIGRRHAAGPVDVVPASHTLDFGRTTPESPAPETARVVVNRGRLAPPTRHPGWPGNDRFAGGAPYGFPSDEAAGRAPFKVERPAAAPELASSAVEPADDAAPASTTSAPASNNSAPGLDDPHTGGAEHREPGPVRSAELAAAPVSAGTTARTGGPEVA